MPLHALISLYDKDGLVPRAHRLNRLGATMISSGGTAQRIHQAGLNVTDVAELVGGAAILGHRVVTLSREVAAGLLATPEDQPELDELGIERIDLVYVDPYPLAAAIAKPDATLASVIEMVDIGGPTMLMEGAKGDRIVVCRPEDMDRVLDEMESGDGEISPELREVLRLNAVRTVIDYYSTLRNYLTEQSLKSYLKQRSLSTQ